jgi:hypothetical protein
MLTYMLKFYACKNGTDIVCKSQEVIDEYLNGGYIGTNFIDTIFDPANYTTPFKYMRKDFFTTVSNLYYKEWQFYMKNVDYYTDQGMLMESEDLKKYLIFETAVEMLDMRKQDNFSNIIFRLSNMRLSVNRKYMKIQDFLAQMGGLMNGLMVILKVILSNYVLNNYFSSMINKLFIIPKEAIIKPQYNKKPSISSRKPKTSENKLGNVPVNPNRSIQQRKISKSLFEVKSTINEEQLKNLEKKKQKLKLSFRDNIRLILCKMFDKKNKKSILFNKGKLRIESHVNIVNINKRFEEYDIIKNTLFDNNATCILAYLMQNKVLKFDDVDRNEYAVKLDDVIKAYNNLEDTHINDSLKNNLDKMISTF